MKNIFTGRFFRKMSRLTVFSVFFLIFLGGLVRITGSGMGCPDWPLCFGKIIPPTCECQLPPDYQERFAAPGKPVEKFNVVHTYTEWINRDVGALTGLFMLLLLLSSLQFFKSDRKIFLFTLTAFLLTLFQAWIGAKVVKTNLEGGMVTIHLLLAFLIMALIMLAAYLKSAGEENYQATKALRIILVVSLLLVVWQVAIGAQVRETVDAINRRQEAVQEWDLALGKTFVNHTYLAVVVLLSHFAMVYMLWKKRATRTKAYKALLLSLGCVFAQLATGTANIFFDFPGLSQLLHITLASLLFVSDFYACLHVFASRYKFNQQTA